MLRSPKLVAMSLAWWACPLCTVGEVVKNFSAGFDLRADNPDHLFTDYSVDVIRLAEPYLEWNLFTYFTYDAGVQW